MSDWLLHKSDYNKNTCLLKLNGWPAKYMCSMEITESRRWLLICLTTLDKSLSTTRISHISLTASKDGIILISSCHLKFRSFNCLSICRPLKQLSKKNVRWCSQEHLFAKIPAKYLRWSLLLEMFNAFSIFFWTLLEGCAGSMKINL